MSVYKPAKSRLWQYDFVVGGARFHGSTGQTSRRAAEKAEARHRLEIAEGRYGTAEAATLTQACAVWWRDVGQHRGDAADVERRILTLQTLIGANRPLREIDAEAVADAIRARRAMPYVKSPAADARRYLPSAATVNRDVIDQLRPILRYAEELWAAKGLRLPVIRWGKLRLKEPAGLVKVYSDAEQAAWLAECGPTTGFALTLLLTYGPRFGELFFELDAFDPDAADGPCINITSRLMGDGTRRAGRKRDTGAHVLPLSDAHAREVAARLGRARAAGLPHIWFVEVTDRQGRVTRLEPLSYYGLQARLNSAAERAKVAPGRVIHGARHHAGTAVMRKSGGNIKMAQRLLGHANIQSASRYVHVLESDLRAALEGPAVAPADQATAPETAADSRNSPEPRKAGAE